MILITVLIGQFTAIAQVTQESNSDTLNVELDTNRVWTSLSEMCEKYPTDKCLSGHNFIEIYDKLFSPMRDSMERFFEIGILNGVSHLMWNEYFPNAQIFGIDIRDYSEKSKGSGIITHVADQSNRKDLQVFIDKYGTDFDVILDDGGHAMDHQQISFGFLFEHLKPGGYYIIEDVHTSLPKYYPDPDFKVNQDGSNTTLFMMEHFIRNNEIISPYMTQAEMKYIEQNIETVDISYRVTRHHSILCIIQKKE